MKNYRIGIIVGSLRKESLNRQLANALMPLLPEDVHATMLCIDNLPLYNQDDDGHPAESVKRFKAEIKSCDGLLFITPEYNRSIPGVLKNAIDHASRPYGESAFAGIPAAVTGVSVGSIGTALAQQHLRNVLAYLDVPLLGQPEAFIHAKEGLFDASGALGAGSKSFFQAFIDRFVDWVKHHRA